MHYQKGAVSLFVVIFATLLISVVTIGFLRLMVQNQQEASAKDLSQSAYDSAQAGVQDAERALLRFETCRQANSCDDTDTSTWNTCNGIIASQLDSTQSANVPEVPVSIQGDGQTTDKNLNQAYTCLKVQLNTDNVVGSADESGQRIVPLFGVSAFTTVQVDWFTRDDMGASGPSNAYKTDLGNPATRPLALLQQYDSASDSGWKPNRPSVLRVQLMQFQTYDVTTDTGGFTLSDFDDANGAGESNANTVFLYPTGTSGSNVGFAPSTLPFSIDARRVPVGTPQPANCRGDLSGGGYACSQLLTLPTPIGGGDRTAYLRITPLYNASHFQVKLLSSNDPADVVKFKNVQPAIDSTGRANDLFRRIVTRVDLLNQNLPYPTDAVDLTSSFCKEFAISDDASQYPALNATNSCKP